MAVRYGIYFPLFLALCFSSRVEFSSALRLSFPGTLWCGPGETAGDPDALGPAGETDACCREHDHCTIPPIKPMTRGKHAEGEQCQVQLMSGYVAISKFRGKPQQNCNKPDIETDQSLA